MKTEKMLAEMLDSLNRENAGTQILYRGRKYNLTPEDAKLFHDMRKRLEYDDLIFDMSSIQAKYRKAENDARGRVIGWPRSISDSCLRKIAAPFMKKHPGFDFKTTCAIMQASDSFDGAFREVKRIIERP